MRKLTLYINTCLIPVFLEFGILQQVTMAHLLLDELIQLAGPLQRAIPTQGEHNVHPHARLQSAACLSFLLALMKRQMQFSF